MQPNQKRKDLEILLRQFQAKPPSPQPQKADTPINNNTAADIAIVGMSGRFPNSPDIDSFWQNLVAERHLIHEIPPDRWNWRDYYGDPSENKTPIKHIGSIADAFRFDAGRFGISPREAEAMDPHQRVLLEVVWETFEHAGYAPAALSGSKTGVFIAMYNTDFHERSQFVEWEQASRSYLATGSSQAIVSNRISYLFNLQGPSEIISTACSSALVGVHKAAQAIHAGDCQMALVGGVSLFLSPVRMVALTRLGILSAEGYCAPFDKDSPGEVMGEGCGAVLLKPLAHAQRDGDTIYALLRATGTNHHGNSSGSITMPSVHAQRDLVVDTYRRASIDPRSIGFIEAHGSGSVEGDMVEILAFEKAFQALAGESALPMQFCGIGSNKGNAGFLEAAGGIAQLVKAVMCLRHKVLPATLHFKAAPPAVDLENSPFYIVDKTIPWESPNGPRRAAINAYGLGGTNAHTIVEEYPTPPNSTDSGPQLFIFSAQQAEQLTAYLHKFVAFLAQPNDVSLRDMAYTLQVGRAADKKRVAVVAANPVALRDALTQYLAGHATALITPIGEPPAALTAQDYQHRDWSRLGASWVHGHEVAWHQLYTDTPARRVALPTYAFAKTHYRLPLPPPPDGATNTANTGPSRRVVRASDPILRDHVVNQAQLLPATAQISFILAEAPTPVKLKRLVWLAPFSVDTAEATCEIVFTPDEARTQVQVFKHTAEAQQLCSTLHFEPLANTSPPDLEATFVSNFQAQATRQVSATEIYPIFDALGQHYGPTFRRMARVFVQGQTALTVLQPPQDASLDTQIGLLDAAGHGILAFYMTGDASTTRSYVPFACEAFTLYRPFEARQLYYGVITWMPGHNVDRFDIKIVNGAGQCFAEFEKFSTRAYQHPSEPAPATPPPKPVTRTPSLNWQQQLAQDIKGQLAAFLKVSNIDSDDDLGDYGLDSIAINETTQQLSTRLGINLPVTTLFEHTTIRAVTDYLAAEFSEELAARYQREAVAEAPAPTPPSEPEPTPIQPEIPLPPVQVATQPQPIPAKWQPTTTDDIAVIGISAQFPKSRTLYDYWHNLRDGHNMVGDYRDHRPVMEIYPDSLQELGGLKAGFLPDAMHFDADFFAMNDEEVFYTDPQQRLFLEVSRHVIEDAGYAPGNIVGSNTGVFVGVGLNEYGGLLKESDVNMFSQYVGTGLSLSGVANRASFMLGVHGPSEAVDTACSSSLVSIHRAIQAMRQGECDLAIAGGVNLIFTPYSFQVYHRVNYLAADWKCKSFGKGGDGWTVGEGIAAVLLKPLQQALAEGDNIYAVIKGTGVIHGGQTHFYLQPNPNKHAELIAKVHAEANVDPHTVVYMEAHGTGTEMGDALEFNSLVRAFRALNQPYDDRPLAKQFCGLGSVKSNLGHAEPAAGIASFVKVVLGLYHAQLPPTLHAREPNPHLRLKSSPFYLVNDPVSLDTSQPLRAGIHSFNFSGGAAHAVVERLMTPPSTPPTDPTQPTLICLSAKTPYSLLLSIQALHTFLNSDLVSDRHTLENIAYTLQMGRDVFEHRWFVVCHTLDEARTALAHITTEQALRQHPNYAAVTASAQEATSMPTQQDEVLGQVWLSGQPIDWRQLYPQPLQRVSLPGYAFDKRRTFGPQWIAGRLQLIGYAPPTAIGTPPTHRAVPPALPQNGQPEPNSNPPAIGNGTTAPPVVASEPPQLAVAPRPSLEAIKTKVVPIIADVMAISPQQIETGVPLTDLSFDSLKIITISHRINEHFHIQTAPPDFFQLEDIDELVTFIHELQVFQEDAPASNQPTHGQSNPIATRNNALVPLQTAGDKPPLFLMPPWAGMVYPYFELARELARHNQPVYGLQARGLYDTPQQSIEAMAADYITAMQTVQPGPPYLIGGWSLGGVVAYEAARQLEQAGHTVALLAILDMPPPDVAGFWGKLNFILQGVVPSIWPYVNDYLRLASTGRSISSTFISELSALREPNSTVRRIMATLQASRAADAAYSPSPYTGQITLFRTERQFIVNRSMTTLGWQRLTTQPIETHYLPGHHFNILRPPQVQILATQLQTCLDAATHNATAR